MEKILIIGNGFDLYHGLPTRYQDFLFFAAEFECFYSVYSDQSTWIRSEGYITIDNSSGMTREILEVFGAHGHLLDPETVKFLSKELSRNAWIQYFNHLESKGTGWVDFEFEIQNALSYAEEFFTDVVPGGIGLRSLPQYIGDIVKVFGFAADLNAKNERLPGNIFSYSEHNSYEEYLQSVKRGRTIVDKIEVQRIKDRFISAMLSELDDLIRCLRYYLQDFVGIIKCETVSEQIRAIGKVNILNFNYTNTFEKIYGTDDNNQHFVHGGVEEDNMVLGVPDDAFPGTTEYIRFQKYFQRIQKRTGNFYKKWLSDRDASGFEQKVEVYVMGHSLGVADFGVLRSFFEQEQVKRITIYYHSQYSYEDLVINLVRALGKDFIIEQIGQERIVFEKLTTPISITA